MAVESPLANVTTMATLPKRLITHTDDASVEQRQLTAPHRAGLSRSWRILTHAAALPLRRSGGARLDGGVATPWAPRKFMSTAPAGRLGGAAGGCWRVAGWLGGWVAGGRLLWLGGCLAGWLAGWLAAALWWRVAHAAGLARVALRPRLRLGWTAQGPARLVQRCEAAAQSSARAADCGRCCWLADE